MWWIPLVAWLIAAAVALVVLGFCAYELVWKARRLQRDLGQLQDLAGQLALVRDDVAAAQLRLARAGVR